MSYGRGDLTGSGGFEPVTYNSGYQENGSYQQLANAISSNIQKISQNVQDIRRMVKQLGGDQDTHDMRDRLQQRQHHTNQMCKDTAKYLRDAKSMPAATSVTEQRHRKTQIERLMGDFSDILNSFQAVQRDAATTSKEYIAKARAASTTDNNDVLINLQQGSLQEQQQSSVTQEDLQEIQEREDAIRQLEADIVDVNMIFKDLGTMVHEQGDLIDSIEANVEHAEADVVQGNTQLVQARRSAASARKKKFICAVVGVVLLVVLALVIYFSVPKNN